MSRSRRALISVSDKTGITDFARDLAARGFEILSTGGTARHLKEGGIEVTPVSEVTGHPEIMEGRVKTLHPAIHGPLLARRDVSADLMALADLGYAPIDVLAVNLYPFRESVSAGGVPVDRAMEQVDIGGPTMIRAAAKNHTGVWVVVDPADYGAVLHAVRAETDDPGLRRALAAKVFRHMAGYDAAVASYLESVEAFASESAGAGADIAHATGAASGTGPASGAAAADGEGGARGAPLPALLLDGYRRRSVLRYGENPDQQAAFYVPTDAPEGGIAGLRQLHGKALSYNNLLDLDGALLSLAPFALSPDPAVCIVKHTTPCGLAIGPTLADAYRKALKTDPMSAFGSVIAVNREVDGSTAEALADLFVECIVAPAFSDEALEQLTRKKNLRILSFPEPASEGDGEPHGPLRRKALADFDIRVEEDPVARSAARFLAAHGHHPRPRVPRGIYGGLLVQTPPTPPFFGVVDLDWKVVSRREPDADEQADLAFAWAAVYGVKSNAILLAADGATLGIGAGQMSRVDASITAVRKAGDAGLDLKGSALASDAFFPFRDGVDAAADAGVRAIVQPGGSMRDPEVIEAADEHDMAMIFTGRRLFRH